MEGSRVLVVFRLFSHLSNAQLPPPYKRFILSPQTPIHAGLGGGKTTGWLWEQASRLSRAELPGSMLTRLPSTSAVPTSLDFLSCLLGRQMESRQRGRRLCCPQEFTAVLPAALLASETLGLRLPFASSSSHHSVPTVPGPGQVVLLFVLPSDRRAVARRLYT